MSDINALMLELGIEPTTDEHGLYTGMSAAFAKEAVKVILSDDESIFNLDWMAQRKMISENFLRRFPYMAK